MNGSDANTVHFTCTLSENLKDFLDDQARLYSKSCSAIVRDLIRHEKARLKRKVVKAQRNIAKAATK